MCSSDLAEDTHITQRRLSTKLSIAIGLTNLYLKRLVLKGYVKCLNVRPNRIQYLITPKGIAEKTRLTYEFMDYSLHLYGQTRRQLRQRLLPLATGDRKRVAIFGSGEAAELAYMSIIELNLELAGVFDDQAEGMFLGKPILDIRTHRDVPFDVLVVASLGAPSPVIARLTALGIAPERLIPLREPLGSLANERDADHDLGAEAGWS